MTKVGRPAAHSELRNAILWTLKLDGDIYRSKASQVLRRRVEQRGVALQNKGLFKSALHFLIIDGFVDRQTDGKEANVLRLLRDPEHSNPFISGSTSKKETPMAAQPKIQENPQYAQILWTLKLDGDINENHKGGNATVVLRERLKARGVTLSTSDFANRMAYLRKTGRIYTITGNRVTKVIRLQGQPGMPNPFPETTQQPEIVEPSGALARIPVEGGSLLNGHRSWPISKRLQLIAELSASIDEDMKKVKNAL